MTSKTKPNGKGAKPKTMTIPIEPAPVELSPQRVAQKEAQRARNQARPYRPKSKVEFPEDEDGKQSLSISMADGQDPELYAAAHMEALGTGSLSFLNDTMDNVVRTLSPSRNIQTQQYNAAVALMAAIEPQNELEATLASQMVAANDGAFRCMRSMASSDWVDQHKMYGDMANKFMRTFTAQIEALSRLRRGGEQIVKHVYVQEGGQAVIAGTVNTTGGRSNFENGGQPYGASATAPSAALPGPDPTRDGVPVPGNAEWPLQNPRREKSRRSEG